MQFNDEQKSIIKQTLQNVVQMALYRTVWGLPPLLAGAIGLAAFGLLMYLSSSHTP